MAHTNSELYRFYNSISSETYTSNISYTLPDLELFFRLWTKSSTSLYAFFAPIKLNMLGNTTSINALGFTYTYMGMPGVDISYSSLDKACAAVNDFYTRYKAFVGGNVPVLIRRVEVKYTSDFSATIVGTTSNSGMPFEYLPSSDTTVPYASDYRLDVIYRMDEPARNDYKEYPGDTVRHYGAYVFYMVDANSRIRRRTYGARNIVLGAPPSNPFYDAKYGVGYFIFDARVRNTSVSNKSIPFTDLATSSCGQYAVNDYTYGEVPFVYVYPRFSVTNSANNLRYNYTADVAFNTIGGLYKRIASQSYGTTGKYEYGCEASIVYTVGTTSYSIPATTVTMLRPLATRLDISAGRTITSNTAFIPIPGSDKMLITGRLTSGTVLTTSKFLTYDGTVSDVTFDGYFNTTAAHGTGSNMSNEIVFFGGGISVSTQSNAVRRVTGAGVVSTITTLGVTSVSSFDVFVNTSGNYVAPYAGFYVHSGGLSGAGPASTSYTCMLPTMASTTVTQLANTPILDSAVFYSGSCSTDDYAVCANNDSSIVLYSALGTLVSITATTKRNSARYSLSYNLSNGAQSKVAAIFGSDSSNNLLLTTIRPDLTVTVQYCNIGLTFSAFSGGARPAGILAANTSAGNFEFLIQDTQTFSFRIASLTRTNTYFTSM